MYYYGFIEELLAKENFNFQILLFNFIDLLFFFNLLTLIQLKNKNECY